MPLAVTVPHNVASRSICRETGLRRPPRPSSRRRAREACSRKADAGGFARVVIAALALLLPLCAAGGLQDGILSPDDGSEDRFLPVDTSESWSVGFASLKTRALSPENRYLRYSIPLLIREGLSSIGVHIYNIEERTARAKYLVEQKLAQLRLELQSLQHRRDEILFGSASGDLAQIRKQKEELLGGLSQLQNLDMDAVAVSFQKPVVFKEGQETGSLIVAPRFSPLARSREEKVDLIVWGEIEEVQDFLYLNIRAFNTVMQKEVFAFESAGSIQGLHDSLFRAVDGLAELMLGRKWARLTVVPYPPDSSVTVNGVLLGTGVSTGRFIEPGDVQIVTSSPGFDDVETVMSLAPYEERRVEILLAEKPLRKLSIHTDPPGADVYVDSIWKGQSPLVLELLASGQRLLVRKEGYREVTFQPQEESLEAIMLTLRKALLDESAWLEKKRDTFYASLGIFFISLPLPIFLYGYALDNANAAIRSDPRSSQYQQFYSQTEITYFAYGATLFISIALFAKMLGELIEYVDYVDYVR